MQYPRLCSARPALDQLLNPNYSLLMKDHPLLCLTTKETLNDEYLEFYRWHWAQFRREVKKRLKGAEGGEEGAQRAVSSAARLRPPHLFLMKGHLISHKFVLEVWFAALSFRLFSSRWRFFTCFSQSLLLSFFLSFVFSFFLSCFSLSFVV
jgi:hypothetical protein